MKIVVDDLEGKKIEDLLDAHRQEMYEISVPDSIHTLTIDALRATEITVWTAWDEKELLGCGALKELDAQNGEIKSMRTADAHLGRGVASGILQHMLGVARQRGYETVYLETGGAADFRPARALYKKAGFSYCGPFADYAEDPVNRFMMLRL